MSGETAHTFLCGCVYDVVTHEWEACPRHPERDDDTLPCDECGADVSQECRPDCAALSGGDA